MRFVICLMIDLFLGVGEVGEDPMSEEFMERALMHPILDLIGGENVQGDTRTYLDLLETVGNMVVSVNVSQMHSNH